MSFQKILVSVDASSQAAIVFEQALELAKKYAASIILFHGIQVEATITIRSDLEVKTQQAQELLQSYQQKAKEQGIPVETSYRVGEPGSSICNVAQSWGADLIVLGRRGHRGITEVLLGSVSNYVLHHAPCSVLVVQGGAIAT